MKYILSLLILTAFFPAVNSQTLSADSVFQIIDSKFSEEAALKIRDDYEKADNVGKNLILQIFSMPLSSRKELIANYDQKKSDIKSLIEAYKLLVPKGYSVFFELKSSGKIPGIVEGIDLVIFKKNNEGQFDMVDGDWDMSYNSPELDKLLAILDWDKMTLVMIKNLLQTANCISIQNGYKTEIGFARSGLGKYSYILFPSKLSTKEMDKYNNGCEFLYYKDNVVLRYVGGMAGPQCFTD